MARRVLIALVVVPVLVATLLAMSIWVHGGDDDRTPSDAAIVLGAAVWNGTPSPVFEARIRHAVDLERTGRVRMIVFTGGVGEGDTIAESDAARVLAVALGVPDEHILGERESRTTLENLVLARDLAGGAHLGRLLIVSDPLHLPRALRMARDLGLDAHPSPTPYTRYVSLRARLRFLAREVYYDAKYRLGLEKVRATGS